MTDATTSPHLEAVDEKPHPDEPAPQSRTQSVLGFLRGGGVLLVLVVLVAYFWVRSPFFMTQGNLLNVGSASSILGLMALTQTLLVVSGGIDISIGANAAFSGVLLGRLIDGGLNVWIAVVIVLVASAMIGMFNGLIAVKLDIDPLVVSLGSFSIFTGAAFLLAERTTLLIDNDRFAWIGSGRLLDVPVPLIIFLLAFVVVAFIERRTILGRAVYAIGGNLEAARLSGIAVDRTRLLLFTLSGLSAGAAGLIITAQIQASSPNIGASFLLSVVTAVILGGASLKGGRGSVVGTLTAIAILGVLENGLGLLQVSSFVRNIVLGILLIAAVVLDQTSRRTGR